jgi:predicted transposase/invertase (TIGR01784 family)
MTKWKEDKRAIFEDLFEVAEKNNLTPKEMATYKKSVLDYNDVRSAMLFNLEDGLKKGLKKGREQEKQEMIVRGLEAGISIDLLSQMSNLSPEYIMMNIVMKNTNTK